MGAVAGAAFVSAGVVLGAGALVSVVAGAGVVTVLVAAFDASLLGASLLLLQPVRTSGRARTEAIMERDEAKEDNFIGNNLVFVWVLFG